MKEILTYEQLTDEQRQMAINQYIAIRECEEDRAWNDILSNPDYPEPIDWQGVKTCRFEYDAETNEIFVDI